ncbi:MAG: hypothetical protein U0872_07790 [Planctomycetaceae bacterium]
MSHPPKIPQGAWFMIVALVLSGCLHRTDAPQPSRDPFERAVQGALDTYASGLAASFEETGAALQSGTLQSAEEANQRLQTANAAARRQAFQPLDELLNEELGGDRWDADRAGRLFQQLSRALRKVPR